MVASPPAEVSGVVEAVEGWAPQPEVVPDPGEVYLSEMLAIMDEQLRCLRGPQQRVVQVVELACRRALGSRFGRLVLVGSVALCAETPGSDVDVVCFTREPDNEAGPPVLPAENLRKVHLRKVLEQLVSITEGQCIATSSGLLPGYSMELIEDARVPILRVTWGLLEQAIAVDVLIDQRRPLDHVRWFQAMHASPRPSAPPPSLTPMVTVSMRCVKWWLRQRQIPRTKEGGLPTIAWLLLALHTCSLPETRKEVDDKGPMAALAVSLLAFFRHYGSPGSLHGVLQFGGEAHGAEKLNSEFRLSPTNKDSPWAELSVLDPIQAGEDINLAPPLSPATQLLLLHELQRAAGHLQARAPLPVPSPPWKGEEQPEDKTGAEQQDMPDHGQSNAPPQGKSRRQLEALFEPLSPLKNALPAIATESVAALLLQGDPSKGVGTIEVAIIDRIVPRQGWSAPFLHRSDTTSELHARMCDVNEGSGGCQTRREGVVVLCPCHFVCMLELERDGSGYKLGEEDLERFRSMRCILSKMDTHQRALGDLNSPPQQQQQQRGERQAAAGGGRNSKRGGRKKKG